MSNQQLSINEIQNFIIHMVNTKKPETVSFLVKLVQQKYPISEKKIIDLLLQLENDNKIRFIKKIYLPITPNKYTFAVKSLWFWLSIIIAITTTIIVFTISEEDYPMAYLRQTLGILFVGFFPGFAFIKMLYPYRFTTATTSENLSIIELIALSIGLSVTLVAIIGLLLNYTPLGIRLTPITFSLFVLTVTFASIAFLRDYNLFMKNCSLSNN